ncbi:hypothetical protein EXT48_21595 [Pseudoalteromonas sp. CO348]|uniref:hypothetical protein n=1 Tax=Pseudoalteromonas sp. CO348 TaxID=1777271 RepID=UPI001022AB5F|nr:hypothetical protein [Pseudoalteromonas sp. CO348]RZF98653.1 hypothetical protein EXT48_21595 [Pseudoalteromonas sp. CO348]
MRQLILLTALTSTAAHAGMVNQVEVKNNTVLFSTESMTDSTLSCASNINKKLRGFSLNTHDGRAMYSLIVAALSKNYAVDVQSALDCADTQDVERIQSLRLLADTSQSNNSSSHSIGVYKHDGVTRIGTYISHSGNSRGRSWQYFDKIASDGYKSASISLVTSYREQYFSSTNCTGESLLLYQSDLFYSGWEKSFVKSDTSRPTLIASKKDGDYCYRDIISQNLTGYFLVKTTHPVCGTGPCKIRED